MKTKTWYAVVPAYEPDERLRDVVRGLKEAGFEVIVVDDGSGPDYAPLFDEVRPMAQVISYETNGGKGHAMKEAFRQIAWHGQESPVITVVDCDGQHTAADAARLAEEAEKYPDALWLGSRRQSKDSPLKSRLGNGVTRLVFRLSSGVSVYDTQTGLRAFDGRWLTRMLAIPGERYEYEMNMLMQCAKDGICIREMPIETIYIENNAGSHFNAVKDSWRIYREILKFSGSSVLSFTLDFLLYSLLMLITGGLVVVSNVLARLASATVNFTVNRRLVFRDKGPWLPAAVRYAALAAGILAANTGLLWVLTTLGVNAFLAKLLTELTLFAVSFLVQKHGVFRQGSAEAPAGMMAGRA